MLDPHAERVRGDHHRGAIVQKRLLIDAPLVVAEPRVIADGLHAERAQVGADLLDGPSRRAVDDARHVGKFFQVVRQKSHLVGRMFDLKKKILAVEARDQRVRVREIELRDDVRPDLVRRRCGERGQHRAAGERGDGGRDVEVRRAEVVPPVRDAVCLIDDDHADVDLREKFAETGAVQPLRRNIEQLRLAGPHLPENRLHVLPLHPAVDRSGADAVLPERVHLILHERNQGRDDDGDAVHQHRGNLITERLSRSGRHDAEDVAPG